MPVHECIENGKPGYQWGKSGKCYTYRKGDKESEAEALANAHKQGYAVEKSGYQEKNS